MSRTNVIGTNNTTPGVMTAPSSLQTDTTSTTGLIIQRNASAPSGQAWFRVIDTDGSTIAELTDAGDYEFVNMKVGAATGVFITPAMFNGKQNPPCVEFPSGARIWGGTGAPASTTVGTGRVGDWYLRSDTPSTSNQRIYVCSTAGTPGTWTAIV